MRLYGRAFLSFLQIRFQHEIYPDDVDKISRDVLLIYDVEIADLLQSSQINKFLYRFSSGSLPLKSSANMVCPALFCISAKKFQQTLDLWCSLLIHLIYFYFAR